MRPGVASHAAAPAETKARLYRGKNLRIYEKHKEKEDNVGVRVRCSRSRTRGETGECESEALLCGALGYTGIILADCATRVCV